MLGELLSLYLRVNQISVKETAAQIGVSPATVSRITRGENIDQETLLKVIQWLFASPKKGSEL